MATTNAPKSFEARELHLKAVTVFTERAEVVRVFSVDLEEGLTDVVVNNVAATLDSESIRVSAPGVTIQKVEFKKSQAKDAQVDSPKVKQLHEEQKTLRSKLATQKYLKEAYKTRLEALDNIATSVPLHTDYAVMGRNFGSLDELFSFHVEQVGQVGVLIQGVEAEIAELEPQVEVLQEQIDKTRRSEAKQKSIVVTLESDAKKKVDMKLTYQVDRACWSPSYDLRVTSEAKSPTTKHAKLHYFADIKQASGEDWNDAEIELSTAEPRRADSAPKLETLNAKMRQRREKPRGESVNGEQYEMINSPLVSIRCARSARQEYPTMNDVLSDSSSDREKATKFKQMRVEKHALTTTFKLPQKTSIPSDSSEHKVTIARLEFDLLVGLECSPSEKTSVFETASAVNDWNYPLLRAQAAVYMDGEFTSKTTIRPTAIGEKFFVTLGVDSDVKVKYTSAEPFREESDDEKTSKSLYEKKIHVKNLKAEEKVLVTIHLQVPKSTDSKIKIELLAPAKNELIVAEDASTPKQPAVGPRLNEENILDWTLELDAGKERELVVKWSVQSPANKTVDYVAQGRAVDSSDE